MAYIFIVKYSVLFGLFNLALETACWTWPRPRGYGLDLGLKCLASASASASALASSIWPRLTSLATMLKISNCLTFPAAWSTHKKFQRMRCGTGLVVPTLNFGTPSVYWKLIKIDISTLPRDAMQARLIPLCGVRPSVRLSVCHVRTFCRNE